MMCIPLLYDCNRCQTLRRKEVGGADMLSLGADELLDERTQATHDQDTLLALSVVDLLVDNETHKGHCSIWQFKHFLDLYTHPLIDTNPEDTVAAMSLALLSERDINTTSIKWEPMGIYAWMMRFGGLGDGTIPACGWGMANDQGWSNMVRLSAVLRLILAVFGCFRLFLALFWLYITQLELMQEGPDKKALKGECSIKNDDSAFKIMDFALK